MEEELSVQLDAILRRQREGASLRSVRERFEMSGIPLQRWQLLIGRATVSDHVSEHIDVGGSRHTSIAFTFE